MTVTTTTLADASPIATPPNLPSLPTGAYNYIINNAVPGANSNSCLPASQSNAWDCATGANLNINVTMQASQTPFLSIGYTMASDPQLPSPPKPQVRYGAQPPTLPVPVKMRLMGDRDEVNSGPAYFFQQAYTKTVILKTQDLSDVQRGQSNWVLNDFVNVTDKPWYCFWNGTLLEGFIYVTRNEDGPSASTDAVTSSFASATATGIASKRRRQAGLATSGTTYPKVIKIEERRPLRNPPQPYCQQMQMDSGEPTPYELNGQPNIVNLNETEPLPLQQQQLQEPSPPSTNSHKEKRQAGPNSNCMCEWQN